MATKKQKPLGRPCKVDYRVMIKLADAIQHNATISESCRYVNISRFAYYYHLNINPVFREMMEIAKSNQNKVVFSFLTTY